MSDVAEKIKKIIADHSRISLEDIHENSLLMSPGESKSGPDSLGMDSIDIVELFVAIGDEYNIDIADEDIDKIKTVEDVIKYIESRTKK